MKVETTINGTRVTVDAAAASSLLDLLRSRGLTGTKEGCGIGVCGACTVLVDELPVSSCIYLAGCVGGSQVWTIEGVSQVNPGLVDAFVDCEGLQCGICTPGQVVAAASISRDEVLDDDAIKRRLAGNLCRCTGYGSIVDAIRSYLAS